MANVIESFYIALGLDTKDYEKKRKEVDASLKKFGEASDKQTKLIAESGKKAAGAFSALKVEILGALAAFGMGAGFKEFIQSSMSAQAAAGRTADALGVSVQSLRAYKLMATEMDESGDAAVGTLNKVAAGLAAARRGDISFLATANKYGAGLTMGDSVETAMSKLNRMAYAIRQKYGEQQAIGALGEIGISDQLQAIRLAQNPNQNAQDHAEAMRKVGVWTPQQIAQNKKLLKQWADFMLQMDNLKIKIANDIEPTLIKLGDQFEKWVDSGGLDRLMTKLDALFNDARKIVSALGGVKGILVEIAAIKVFGWITRIGMWVWRLKQLTAALAAARAAAAVGGAAAAAGGAGAAAGAAAGGATATEVATAVGGASVLSKLGLLGRLLGKFGPGLALGFGFQKDEMLDWRKQLGLRNTNPSITRGIRNNNPGNIKYGAFARSMGATGQDSGGFAIFPTAQQGIAAIAANLRSYGRKGFDTPSEIARRWSTTDQGAYTKTLAAIFGGNANKQLDLTNTSVLAALTNAIISQENGRNPYLGMVNGYVGAPRGSQTAGAKNTSNTNTVTINGPINVQTKATDANGVAMGMKKALRDNPLIAGSVTALA